MLRKLVGPRLALCFLCIGISCHAAENNYCPAATIAPTQNSWQITADQLSGRIDGKTKLSGNVQLEQGNNHLRADNINYNSNTNTFWAQGNVQYTNCNVANPSWFITADQITLNQDQAVAREAWFIFGGLPIAYFPRYRIPLNNQRKSGFLTPDVSNSSSSGLNLGTPFYFNFAPNYDAIFAPRLLTRRGLQFNSEYRYLFPLGEGKIHGDWLNDRRADDNKRYAYSFEHQKAGKKAQLQLHYQRVSDNNYIDDLGGSLQSYGEGYLRSYAQLDYTWKGWQLNFLGETLQEADKLASKDDRPYERRPSFTLARQFFTVDGSEWNFHTNLTEFDYRGNEEDKISGSRLDNALEWKLPYRRPGFHFTPTASLRYTHYDLQRKNPTHRSNHPNSRISRTIPSFSLRAGLVFEKNKTGYRRTLEPEIYYLNVPSRKQSDIPIYDTTEPEFRFNELFRDNRYTGIDRIAAADQLSVALTHRILHSDSGKEVLRASLGQIFYFKNNRTTLNNANTIRDTESDIAAELMFDLNRKLTFNNTYVWNTDIDRTSRLINRLSLNAGSNRIINLFHRYQRGEYRQAGINFSLPLFQQWRMFGGWSRDTMNNQDLLTMAGFEYQSCCWKIRLLGQRFLKDLDGDGTLANGDTDYDTTIGIELNFRGLGALETDVENVLQERIHGYNE